jgi:hypothetical protein
MNVKQSKIAKWEKTRKQGKWYFIVKYGIIGWGVTFWLLMSLWESFSNPNGGIFAFGPFNASVFYHYTLIGLPISVICGFSWGLCMWNWAENKYQKYIEESETKKHT